MTGLYVSITPDGKIKRHLSTEHGEVPLKDTTVSDELISLTDCPLWEIYSFTQTSHPVSGVEVPINPLKSRKRFMSAGKPARKSVTSAQISSFRVINPSSSFWRKSCNFSKAAAKEISAISSAVRQNSGPDERRSLSSRTPTARNRYRVNTMAVWAHMAS